MGGFVGQSKGGVFVMKYKDEVMDHVKNPRNRKVVEDASHEVKVVNASCGDKLSLSLRIRDGVVEEVGFEDTGCALVTAVASMITEKIKGQPVKEVKEQAGLIVKKMEEEVSLARIKCVRLSWEGLLEVLEGKV